MPDPARGTRQPHSPRCVFSLRTPHWVEASDGPGAVSPGLLLGTMHCGMSLLLSSLQSLSLAELLAPFCADCVCWLPLTAAPQAWQKQIIATALGHCNSRTLGEMPFPELLGIKSHPCCRGGAVLLLGSRGWNTPSHCISEDKTNLNTTSFHIHESPMP